MCLAAKRIAPGSVLLVCLRQRREGGTRLDGDAEIDWGWNGIYKDLSNKNQNEPSIIVADQQIYGVDHQENGVKAMESQCIRMYVGYLTAMKLVFKNDGNQPKHRVTLAIWNMAFGFPLFRDEEPSIIYPVSKMRIQDPLAKISLQNSANGRWVQIWVWFYKPWNVTKI